jgi:hypothetical protein
VLPFDNSKISKGGVVKTIRSLITILLALAILLGLVAVGCQKEAKTSKDQKPQEKTRSDLSPAAPDGHVYYITKEGSDKNAGTAEKPWLTIGHAAEKAAAGDKIYVRAGTYNESVQIKKNGSKDAHIVFAAYPDEKPIIEGTGVTDWNNGIIIEDSSYIEIAGFEIRKWRDNGMEMSNSNHLKISDCEIHETGGGVQLLDGSHDFEFNRVEAHHYDLLGFDASPGEGAPCYNGTFKNCSAHTGRDHDQNVDGFALGHGKQHDFKLSNCKVYDVYDGFDLSASDTTVNNCSVYNCWYGGFKLWNNDITVVNCLAYNNEINVTRCFNGPTGTATLRNCTLVDAGTFNVSIETTKNSLHMYNCILAGGKNIGLAFEKRSSKNYEGDYNLFHCSNAPRVITVGYEDEFSLNQLSDWRSYSGQDRHSVMVKSLDKIFVDPKKYDLHLAQNSPAIDKGQSNGAPSKDFEGKSRPQGKAYDIGAYEY